MPQLSWGLECVLHSLYPASPNLSVWPFKGVRIPHSRHCVQHFWTIISNATEVSVISFILQLKRQAQRGEAVTQGPQLRKSRARSDLEVLVPTPMRLPLSTDRGHSHFRVSLPRWQCRLPCASPGHPFTPFPFGLYHPVFITSCYRQVFFTAVEM